MQFELQMVGAYQNTHETFKGVPFVNGRASIVCADEHVAGICRYLQQFGAYPLVEAEVLQAKLDKACGKKVSKKTATDRVLRCRAALAQAESDLSELDGIDDNQTNLGVAAEPAQAQAPSRKQPPRVVVPEETLVAESVSAEPAEIESEFSDGGSTDSKATRRERREASSGGKSSAKTRQGGK